MNNIVFNPREKEYYKKPERDIPQLSSISNLVAKISGGRISEQSQINKILWVIIILAIAGIIITLK